MSMRWKTIARKAPPSRSPRAVRYGMALLSGSTPRLHMLWTIRLAGLNIKIIRTNTMVRSVEPKTETISQKTCVPVCVSSICFVHLKWVKYQPEIRKLFHIYSLCMDLLNYTWDIEINFRISRIWSMEGEPMLKLCHHVNINLEVVGDVGGTAENTL